MALLDFMEKLGSATDKNLVTLGVFIDLKKAFDTIDHMLLLEKLSHYGIRGIVNDWLRSYLFQRKQCVDLNGVLSDYQNVKCGVPQGSILGPKLFILYINALKTLDECEVVNWRINVCVELNRQKNLSFTTRAEETRKKTGGWYLLFLLKTVIHFGDFW